MKFNPLRSSEKIVEDYRRYILTIFKTDIASINEQLAKLVSPEAISNGPFLSIAPNYLRGNSLKSLVPEKASPGFLKMPNSSLNPEFTLYKHQEDAFETVAVKDHNLVLSTGTGSGKTFSFLLPVLNYLLSEKEKGTLNDGVRAMIVYPMNALANDQMDVLRGLLKGTGITFGSFTGETEESDRKAREIYENQYGKCPDSNELISREVMNRRPPNILITNYAMLERLLILPSHKELFGTPGKNHWKYIILDEAHMYSGAKGTEVAALIRRLKETLKRPQLRFLLTSATLGGGTEDDPKVVKFANDLCGTADSECPFEKSDIVRSSVYEHAVPLNSENVSDQFYTDITEIIEDGYDEDEISDGIVEYLDEKYPGEGSYRERIYGIVSKDPRVSQLRDILKDGAKSAAELIKSMRTDQKFFTSFVQVISLAEKDRYRLFDSKYHMFIRGIDGVYTTLNPNNPKVFIHKCTETKNEETGKSERVFEISTCANCGHLYLVGKIKDTFVQNAINESFVPDEAFMLIMPNEFSEEDYLDENGDFDDNLFELCVECGKICPYSNGSPCDCGNSVFLYRTKENSTKVCRCPNCGRSENIRGMLRSLYLGHDSSTAVIASSLFNELKDNSDHRFLSFSDNRQNAAYFAPYLAETHENIVLHAAMYQVIMENEDLLSSRGMNIKKFHGQLDGLISEKRIYSDGPDSSSADAWIMLFIDAARYGTNKSFEYLGQIYYTYPHKPIPISGLTDEESDEFVNQIAKLMRDKVCISRPHDIAASEVWYQHYNREPTATVVTNKEGRNGEVALVTASVKRYIEKVTGTDNANNIAKKVLHSFERAQNTSSFVVGYGNLVIKRKNYVYQCTKCLKRSPFNVKNVCCYCLGTLEKIDTSVMNESDSYVYNYMHTPLNSLRVKEHTAQLDKDTARDYQNKFKNKELDALSCSTTFEVGVDIGNLNVVLMRNMPPTPANYIQRAGRAGRSPDSSAYAVTFCKNSPHDTNYFNNPLNMIQGRVPVPNISTDNLRITIRHIFASALSLYWKNVTKEAPAKIDDFLADYGGFRKYLAEKPEDLKQFLKGSVPKEIQDHKSQDSAIDVNIDLENFGWVDELFNADHGRLTLCSAEYKLDMESINEYETKNGRKLDSIRNMLSKENMIEYLSRHNVIPKYGFPSEVVELRNKDMFSTDLKLRLQRDLSLAISDYAPDSEIIADGKVLRSKYLKKLPSKDWPKYYYRECKICASVNIILYTGQDIEDVLNTATKCPMCSQLYTNKLVSEFIVPKYGFLYESEDMKEISSRKPAHTYAGEIFYRGNNTTEFIKEDIPGHEIYCMYGRDDELVIINKSPFKICPLCGYGTLNGKIEAHSGPTGKPCSGTLFPRTLGHVFKTDVFVLDLADCKIDNYETAISILAALLNSFVTLFSIDESEINGCISRRNGHFCFVLFDNTPGGAGYVKSILADNADNILLLVKTALDKAQNCTCGSGDKKDCACYGCLLTYRNQRHHEEIKRSLVINALAKYGE